MVKGKTGQGLQKMEILTIDRIHYEESWHCFDHGSASTPVKQKHRLLAGRVHEKNLYFYHCLLIQVLVKQNAEK